MGNVLVGSEVFHFSLILEEHTDLSLDVKLRQRNHIISFTENLSSNLRWTAFQELDMLSPIFRRSLIKISQFEKKNVLFARKTIRKGIIQNDSRHD